MTLGTDHQQAGGDVASPCTSVCKLDADELCIGCGRSVEEIMGWTRMSAAEKIAANRRAANRRRTMANNTGANGTRPA